MARKTDDASISSRAARERLVSRHEPYWREIEGGLALGYRKGARRGVWVARLWEAGRYIKVTLGHADDILTATQERGEHSGANDDAKVLDFRQAQANAVQWAERLNRVAAGLEAERPKAPAAPYTVANAMADYLADYAARGGKSLSTTQKAVEAHILPALGSSPVGKLAREGVKSWHRALAAAPPRVRSKKGEKRHRDTNGDADAPRRRRSSANRILTILKAALNHARSEGKVTCAAEAWGSVKPFREVVSVNVVENLV